MGLGRDYLEMVLRLRRLVPGWVESYVGPPELLDAVAAGKEASAQKLRESVQELAERIHREETDPDRSRWLLAQWRAISTALRWLGGERLSYAALFERCHGASVKLVPERQFEQAHALLDRALPGHGDVAARYRAWRETQLIPRDDLRASLDLLAAEMRRRCREIFDLPDDERVAWELVSGRPWAANASYVGQRQTLISINVDLPISSSRLLELVCHEAYPGHHTENVCKDASLIESAGREELSVYVYPDSPSVDFRGPCELRARSAARRTMQSRSPLAACGRPASPTTTRRRLRSARPRRYSSQCGRTSLSWSYTQKLWMRVTRKAAYLPG